MMMAPPLSTLCLLRHCNAFFVVLLVSMVMVSPATPLSAPRKKIALVTGANKGIGKEIARRLGAEADVTAVLACRDVALGRAAAEELRRGGCDARALPTALDLTDPDSLRTAADWVRNEYGVLDVLINNAAVCFNDPTLYGKVAHTPFERQAGVTIRTNYFGTLAATRAFLPLLEDAPSPRIVNVASAAGRLTILRSRELVEAFTAEDLTVPRLSALMERFVADVGAGTHADNGWPGTCYGVSKVGVIALTRVLARERPGMTIASVDPGYCRTDQNNNRGVVDPVAGARTACWLALMGGGGEGGAEKTCSGLHFYEEREMPWTYQT